MSAMGTSINRDSIAGNPAFEQIFQYGTTNKMPVIAVIPVMTTISGNPIPIIIISDFDLVER